MATSRRYAAVFRFYAELGDILPVGAGNSGARGCEDSGQVFFIWRVGPEVISFPS